MGKTNMDVLFTWCRPGTPEKPDGYKWTPKDTSWRGRRYLVPRLGGRAAWTEYVPNPGLFRTFVGLSSTKDEMLMLLVEAFAAAYGDIIAGPEYDYRGGNSQKNATLETWCRAIQHMRRAVELWDGINDTEKHEDIKQRFTRPKGAILYWQEHHPLERKSDNTTCPPLLMGKDAAKYPIEEIVPLARKALQYEIQSAFTDTETPSHTTPCIVAPELWLALRPANLLAFMWLCFARVVSGEVEERPCEMFRTCHEYIYVGSGPSLQRSDATTCSAECRQKKKRALKRYGKPGAQK